MALNPKPRKLTKADKRQINLAGCRNMIQQIQEIETQAHDLGMFVTAHAINRAKNALGWEIQGDIEQAGRAAIHSGGGDGE